MKRKSQALKFGLLGIGKIALRSIIPAMLNQSDCELVALGTNHVESWQSNNKKTWPDHIFLGSYSEVCQRNDLDAIYIALPNHLHFEWTQKALSMGKHVFCEKPLALKVQDALFLRNLAQQKNLILAEAFMYRHHPQMDQLKAWLESGAIGELRSIESQFSYRLDDLKNIRLKAECGGGALRDVGCYGIDASRYITGLEPIQVQSMGTIGKRSGVDERTVIQMQFANGVFSQIFVATDSARNHHLTCYGTQGRIELNEAFVPAIGKKVCAILHNEKGQQVSKIGPANPYALELSRFANSVDQGQLSFPMEDGVNNSRILESCFQEINT